MFNILLAGGYLIIPLIICSILALAIIVERTWYLKYTKIIPTQLTKSLLTDIKNSSLSPEKYNTIENSSPLGSLLIFITRHIKADRDFIISHLEEKGGKIIHNCEKHLNLLGTIATISPLLGLLGTVIGMIDVFTVITEQGVGSLNTLAGGISQALITTAVGLSVAIPSLVFYRSFLRKIEDIAYGLEHEALNFYEEVRTIIRSKSMYQKSFNIKNQKTTAFE